MYRKDVRDLALSVQYSSKERLAVGMAPEYLAPYDQSLHILSPTLTVPQPDVQYGASKSASDRVFSWTNQLDFKFRVFRAISGDIIFDSYGHKTVYTDQFLELVMNIVPHYNV
ncbi:hypothetical protein LTR22_027970, partial [Elasticomyces elasticus]